MKRRILIALSFILITGAVVYTVVWFAIERQIETKIIQIYEQAGQQNITIKARAPFISGFPGAHKVRFSGTITYGIYSLNIPRVILKSFFLPGSKLSVRFPKGLNISGMGDPALWSVDYIMLESVFSQTPPYELTSYLIKRRNLSIDGSGWFALDEQSQPSGELKTRITGAIPFLDELTDRKLVKKKDSRIAKIVLGGLSKNNPETGKKTLEATLTLQNRMLFLGPLRLMTFPKIHMDSSPKDTFP